MLQRICNNRDDHAKNFSWLYDPKMDCWHPSPAYDLTWSMTYYGEHTTSINGNVRDSDMKDLLTAGKNAGIRQNLCRQIADAICEKTASLEEKYRGFKS